MVYNLSNLEVLMFEAYKMIYSRYKIFFENVLSKVESAVTVVLLDELPLQRSSFFSPPLRNSKRFKNGETQSQSGSNFEMIFSNFIQPEKHQNHHQTQKVAKGSIFERKCQRLMKQKAPQI